jgi:hypothetical protein
LKELDHGFAFTTAAVLAPAAAGVLDVELDVLAVEVVVGGPEEVAPPSADCPAGST